ncbi:MAG TPA: membrane protein insertase YidC [Acetobacteraceae bacterium]|jgi:YidC/Oxa1 family membrane protein insertase
MDQKRLILAIAISLAILLGFQWLMPRPQHAVTPQTAGEESAPGQTASSEKPVAPGAVPTPPGAVASATTPPREVPRLKINAPRVLGSISLIGARLDDIVLRDYRETTDPTSPQVRILEPKSNPQPYYVQFGWSGPAGSTVKVPDSNTLWTASGNELGVDKPVTLSWDNGQGLVFEIALAIDDNFMFTAQQRVRNTGTTPVTLYPWSRISRDYTPAVLGTYVLHEGMVGWLDGHLKEVKYSEAKSDAQKNGGAPAFSQPTTGGWGGITDKYWLIALVPDQSVPVTSAFRYANDGGDSYQMYMVTQQPEQIAPGAQSELSSRVFTGAKEVHLLDRYETQGHVPNFSYAVDWGWFFFITKPFFYAIDWLNTLLGNFGLAIMVFTVCVKGLFFPLANRSYRSMSKMKLLGPKIQALRDQYKDEPAKLQSATMQLYKTEKVNPVSGCLPMVIQIPVFFSLYKVIYTTIEMRQAPFFGWIHDLSVPDPTNVFNLFGLIPFDPSTIAPFLHLGAWPLIMGFTMFMQQKLNPPPPDPVQAKIFQFMPLIFMFMLARFPAGLVIYWSWNNTLTIAQQWVIMRQTRLAKPSLART